MMSTADAALEFVRRGFVPLPLPFGEKAPRLPDWQHLRIGADNIPRFFTGARQNVGLLCGEPSGGLVDVDCDASEAVRIAHLFLRATEMRHGRTTKPHSHYWYRADPVPAQVERYKDTDGTTLVELRSTGGQTIVPPSVHPSGEPLIWEAEGEPAAVNGDELSRAVRHIAVTSLIARHWSQGSRHDTALALAGTLLRHGWTLTDATGFVRAVCIGAGDDETLARLRDVSTTRERLVAGKKATGIPKLRLLFGDAVMDRVVAWLELTASLEPRRPDSRGVDSASWTAKVTLLADVQPEAVHWLWPGYIPLGKLTVLDGDPGNGKSTMMCNLAARLSSNRPMPDGSMSDLDSPAGVVLLSAEDGPADTIRPRLDAAGADVQRIALLECAVNGERERGITLTDLDHIETAIARVDARLVIIDPLMAYLGSDTNSYRDQDVRGVLAPLARLADRTGAAIVVIRHFSKGQNANVLYRGGGSIGIIGAARVGLIVAPDPDEPDGPRRVLAVAKSNLAMKPPAMAYRLTQAANGVAFAAWEGATHHTAAMLTSAPPEDEERNAQTDAAGVLRAILAAGPVAAEDVKGEAKRAGVSERTLWRAKAKLGVRSFREGFGDGARWLWELPPDAPDEMPERSVPKDAEGCQPNGMADFGEDGTLRPDSDDATICRAWLDGGISAMTGRQIAAARQLLGIGDGQFGDVRIWRARLAEICGVDMTELAKSAD